MCRDIFNQIRLLRALSNLALNISRDGASITSLGNLTNARTSSHLVVKETFGGQQRHKLLAALIWSSLHLVLCYILFIYVYKVQHSETRNQLPFIPSAESGFQISWT